MRFASSMRALLLALCGLIFTSLAAGQSPAAQSSKPEDKTPVCAGCHEDKHASIVMTAHGAKNDAQGSMCQACHGDATEHL
ncbi:MAG TPA: hypothetical protein VMN79_20630, partial [Casimicrobiaceae bacterium]|nr:hypothetical protein [Casimicrobiaceae bacterium]